MNKNLAVNFKKSSEKGIALVEMIVALGIAAIVITSLVSLSISSLRMSVKSKLLLEGSKIANRELELVRAYRDNSTLWAQFIADIRNCNNPCSMNTAGGGLYLNPTIENLGTTEVITRSFTATTPGGAQLQTTDDIARISVSVTWKIGAETKGAYLYTDLTNWRGE